MELKLKLIVIMILITISYEIKPFKTGTLSEDTSCEKVFLEYKDEQKDFFAIGEGTKLTFNRQSTKMGGFAIVCSNGVYNIYTLQKKNERDSEMDFLSNWLYDRLVEERDKEEEKEKTDSKGDKEEKKEKTDSKGEKEEKKEKMNSKGEEKYQSIEKKVFNLKKTFQFPIPKINNIQLLYSDKINDEIFLFTLKSPCAFCLNSYLIFAQYYNKVKLHIYYSNFFEYKNDNLLEKDSFYRLEIVRKCSNYYEYIKNYYQKKRLVLKCINESVTNFITGKEVLPNLIFSRISMNVSFDRIISTIFLGLDLF